MPLAAAVVVEAVRGVVSAGAAVALAALEATAVALAARMALVETVVMAMAQTERLCSGGKPQRY